jgi:hypothetical protein
MRETEGAGDGLGWLAIIAHALVAALVVGLTAGAVGPTLAKVPGGETACRVIAAYMDAAAPIAAREERRVVMATRREDFRVGAALTQRL